MKLQVEILPTGDSGMSVADYALVLEAANSLRTLAGIQDMVSEVEQLGGTIGRRELATVVYTHLQGGSGDDFRDQADAIERAVGA